MTSAFVVAARFWAKVDRSGGPDACWPWLRSIDQRGGYGYFGVEGRTDRAHRVAYRLAVGPIPDGLDILHSCDNPPCANPRHLRPGTNAENVQDRVERGRNRHPGTMGAASSRAVLTELGVMQIRQSHALGESCRRIAARFGVDHSTIARVVRRQTWSNVPAGGGDELLREAAG